MEGCATEAEMNGNVLATIARGYTRLNEHLGTCSGKVSIVGSGPSVRQTCKELKGDILAINSAIGFLLREKIVPKYAMIWDASPLCAGFAEPHPDVTYLIGARCHPAVFERLKGCKVICWHAGGDHNIAQFLAEQKIEEPMVNGGSAGVTRAMYLAVALGYRELELHGADSSKSGDETHVLGSLVPEKDIFIWVGNGEKSKRFRTTPEMAAQVNEFRDIYQLFQHPSFGIEVSVRGEGMLPHMAKLMRGKKLWNPDGTPGENFVRQPQSLDVSHEPI